MTNILKKFGVVSAGVLGAVVPLAGGTILYAQGNDAFDDITGSFRSIEDITQLVLVIIVILTMVVFAWQVVRVIKSNGGQEEMKNLGWSVLALSIFAALWGITVFLGNVTGIDEDEDAKSFNAVKFEKGASV